MAGIPDRRRLRCARCGVLKERYEFHVRSNRASGRASRCRDCESSRKKATYDLDQGGSRSAAYQRTAESVWANRLWSFYRLRPAQYNAMLEAQGGLCALCRRPEKALNPKGEVRRLAVDHDHNCCSGATSCGVCVRGLLCSTCNLGLGALGDDVELMRRAIEYVASAGVLV